MTFRRNRFRPRPFIGEHLEDVGELARGLAGLRQGDINRREIGGMLGDRLGKTFAGHDAGANFIYDRAQSSDIAIVGEQFEAIVEARACLEKQRKVAGKNSDVFRARPVEESDRDPRSGSGTFLGDRFDRNEAKIFYAMSDFRGSRRENRSVDDLAGLGHRKITKIPHRVTVSL